MAVDVRGDAVARHALDGGREILRRHIKPFGIVTHITLRATDAIGAKYNKTAAQVALRWLTQRGIVAIPKSSHKERMAQNSAIFDFTLTDEDMALIAKLNQHDTGTINFGDPQFVKYLIENYG